MLLTFVLLYPLPSIASECIVSGETKSATIRFSGETHSYYFWAEAGQGVVIEMADLSDAPGPAPALLGLEPRLRLYDPDVNVVRDVGSDGSCWPRATITDYRLNMTGMYTIVVSDADGHYSYYGTDQQELVPDTGDYALSLVVTGSTTTSIEDRDGGEVTVGRAVNGTITPGGDTDTYVFWGKIGQGVWIEMIDRSSTPGPAPALLGLEPRLQLYDPNGVCVRDMGSDGGCWTRATIADYRLNVTGIFTIVVSDADGHYSYYGTDWQELTPDGGEYGLSVSVMPPKEPRGMYPCDPQPVDGQVVDLCDCDTLSWCPVNDATGYEVYFSDSPCMPLEMVAENIQDSYVPMPVVEGGQDCSWRVVAHTPDGDIQGPTWWFATEPSDCSLLLSTIGQGSIIDPNEGFYEYPCGDVEWVTAVADPDFEFVRWEGTAVDANKVIVVYEDSIGSQVSVSVDGAYTLTAVFEEVIDDISLDSDPGWIIEGQWEFGVPTGQGGEQYGNPDPASGYTGSNVFGVNLNGDYEAKVGPLYSLLAGPFNLSGYSDVNLRFARWLNTDESRYVKISVDASIDGESWFALWESTNEITDSQWIPVKYFLGAEADGQTAVYLRWTYQVVDERAYPYSGWNLDDIQLYGKRQ